jgi:hypothetical protein
MDGLNSFGIGASAGCPDKVFVGSGDGTPCSSKTFGEWQSSHPPIITRYWPRLTGSSAGAAVVASDFAAGGLEPQRVREIMQIAKPLKNSTRVWLIFIGFSLGYERIYVGKVEKSFIMLESSENTMRNRLN